MGPKSKKQMIQEGEYVFPYHYLDLSSEFHKFFRSMEYFGRLQKIINLVSSLNKKNILDAGCGDGRFCYELKKLKDYKIVGVDYSKKAIAFARAFNPKIKFFVQDLEKLSLPYKFDAIILTETLEHIIPKKIPLILSNLSKILKDDGKLIITVPSKNLPVSKKHYQHFSKESLADAVNSYFKIERIEGYLKLGHNEKIFDFLGKIGILLYPFRKRFIFLKSFFLFREKYYFKNISKAKLNECKSLIAILSKNK